MEEREKNNMIPLWAGAMEEKKNVPSHPAAYLFRLDIFKEGFFFFLLLLLSSNRRDMSRRDTRREREREN